MHIKMKTMKKIISIIAAIPFLLVAVSASAQNLSPDVNYYSFNRLESVNPWLSGSNPAGLAFNAIDISSIDLFYMNENGGFRNVWDGKKNDSFGFSTKSYKKVGQVYLYGKMSFDYAYQNEKGWGGNVYPWSTPLMMADNITGQQRRERYNIDAGLSIPLGEKFLLGVSANYWGISNAKMRDARNENNYMELEATPALIFKSGPVNLGLSATYGRKSEYIKYSLHGTIHNPYVYFFRGLWFADRQLMMNTSIDRQYTDNVWKGAFQAELIFGPDIRFFNEFSMQYSDQSQDQARSDSEGVTYGSNDRLGYDYKGALVIRGGNIDHNVNLKFSTFDLLSYVNVVALESAGTGTNTTHTVPRGRIRDYSENYMGFGAEYKLHAKRTEWNSCWDMTLGAEYFKWDKTYYVFPIEYFQQIKNTRIYANFNKNILCRGTGTVDAGIGLGYTIGGGVMNDERIPEGSLKPSGSFTQELELLEKYYHYMADDRLDLNAVVRYNHFLNKLTGLRLYCEVAYNFAKPLSDVYFNPHFSYRHTTKVSVGLVF